MTAATPKNRTLILRHITKGVCDIALHPLVLYTVAMAALVHGTLCLTLILLGCVAPFVIGLALLKTNKIQSLFSCHSQTDRQLLLLINTTFYTTINMMLIHLQAPIMVRLVPLLASVVMVVSLLLVTQRNHPNGHFVALSLFIILLIYIALTTPINIILPLQLLLVAFGLKAYLWLEAKETTLKELLISFLLGASTALAGGFVFLP